jgi:tetratricopeptide (TPR) repeat protein
MSTVGCLVALLMLAGAGAAHAEDDVAKAKKLFASGSRHFDLSEFDAALRDFKEAYRLKDDPVFLFNIGQCHRALHQPEDAILAYRSFLRRRPDTPNRADVEQKIVALEQEQREKEAQKKRDADAAAAAAAAAAPTAPAVEHIVAPPPKKTPVYKKWWLWTAVAGGVVAIGLGVGLGVGLTRGRSTPSSLPGVSF